MSQNSSDQGRSRKICFIREEQHKHKLFGPHFPRTFLTLMTGRPWVKKFSPSLGPQKNALFGGPQKNALFGADVHDFRRRRPRFSAQTSMTSTNFVQKKFALIFGPYFSDLGRVPSFRNLVNFSFYWFSLVEEPAECSQNSSSVNLTSARPLGELNWTVPMAKSSQRLSLVLAPAHANSRVWTTM